MPTFSQHDLKKHMHVYSSDNQNLGPVTEVYEDSFLLREGLIIHEKRYLPYSAIASIGDDTIRLSMTTEQVQSPEWQKRPDYEDHLGDPLQLMYDRGHGIHDPFDEVNPTQS